MTKCGQVLVTYYSYALDTNIYIYQAVVAQPKPTPHHRNFNDIFNMEPVDNYALNLDLAHEWDDEADTKIKASILSFLVHSSTTSAHEVANDITSAFKSGQNVDGFRDEVEEICIYTSKCLPANHVSQDRLVEIVKALRELPQRAEQPQWQKIFRTGSYLLIEAEGKGIINKS
jgi:hypothetical protein